jgi:hypothetical protein
MTPVLAFFDRIHPKVSLTEPVLAIIQLNSVGAVRNREETRTGDIFFPHTPDAGCRCRKPALGMLLVL